MGRLRVAQQCRARVSLPASTGLAEVVVFTCNLSKGHADPNLDAQFASDHAEVGRVRTKDGTVRSYKITWAELPPEVWRL